jgi:UDP-N-acetylglucosamine 1-carboxyvinyltransferase
MKLEVIKEKIVPGDITVSGSKNSSLAIICAAIICDEEVILDNVPDIHDVQTLFLILRHIGYSVEYKNNKSIIKQVKKVSYKINDELVKKMRGSYYFMGALLAKLRKVSIASAGGCNLGHRPINYHLMGFKLMGATITQKKDVITLKAKKLVPTTINLEFPSVGATINLILASCKTPGQTIINNCALEPEIIDVVEFLNKMGAKINGAGTKTITITGVNYLRTVTYKIMADRIEAGTYLILGALLDGATIRGIEPIYIQSLIDILIKSGYTIETNGNITVKKEKEPKPLNVVIGPYPMFPTDLGQPLSVLATQINGKSRIQETIFKNRYSHVEELNKMGAKIVVIDNNIIINGITPLETREVIAHDLRGAAALVLGGTLTDKTIIDNIDVFLRGYENPIEKLASFGFKANFID